MAQNDALMKGLKQHCGAMQKSHDAMAATCDGLHECYKSDVAEGLRKAMPKEHFADMRDCHKAASESWGRLAEKCAKSAGTDDDIEKMTAAVATAVIDKIGNMVQPTDVRKVFQTPDPNAVSGLTLVGRSGGPTPPTSMESIPPELRSMVAE
jgi:hypothetical protein